MRFTAGYWLTTSQEPCTEHRHFVSPVVGLLEDAQAIGRMGSVELDEVPHA